MTDTQEEQLPPKREISAEELLDICDGVTGTRGVKTEGVISFWESELDSISSIDVKDYLVSGTVEFSKKKYTWEISFINCHFLNDVHFNNSEFQKEVLIEKCTFENGIKFTNPSFANILTFRNIEVSQNISIEGGKYSKLFSFDATCRDKKNHDAALVINGGDFNRLVIGNLKTILRSIEIFGLGISGNVFVTGNDTVVNNILINSISRHLMLSLENISVNSLSISSFHTSVKFTIHNIRAFKIIGEKTEFLIQRSNLGATEISTVNLKEFDIVNIRDSYISDINFVNTIWPTAITSYTQSGSIVNTVVENKETYFFKNRDVYRQLKYASGKYGDNIQQQHFHTQEMVIYRKYLWYSSGLKSFSTWLILILSSVTSDFGQNIWKPIFWLLTGHMFLYIIALCCAIEANTSEEFAYQYFYLLSPIHQYIFCNDWTIIIDIFMRIWSSYMIYNFIRASRRFIK